MSIVYVSLSLDIVHHGHMNLLENARKYGDIIIGLLTDKAIANNKRLPLLNYSEREKIAKNLIGVKSVIPQNEWDYSINIRKIKPDFFVHGDDWKEMSNYRENIINVLNEYGGNLIEIPYTEGISSSKIISDFYNESITPERRLSTLSRLIKNKDISRFIETHSPISALIAQNISVNDTANVKSYDGFWSSSLTDSTQMGKPDIEILDLSSRLNNINNIFEVTNKPLIMDMDTGGKNEHFALNIKTIERLGVSAVIIEDKKGLKKNSLFGNDVKQELESIDNFCMKINSGISKRSSSDFLIISRIESLILEKPMNEALERADAYIDAGTDGILIHSRKKSGNEIIEFAKLFREKHSNIPLICVPTSYNHIYESELAKVGFNVVIYANHLLRASYPAMKDVAEEILRNGRSLEVDEKLMSIKEILELIPGTK